MAKPKRKTALIVIVVCGIGCAAVTGWSIVDFRRSHRQAATASGPVPGPLLGRGEIAEPPAPGPRTMMVDTSAALPGAGLMDLEDSGDFGPAPGAGGGPHIEGLPRLGDLSRDLLKKGPFTAADHFAALFKGPLGGGFGLHSGGAGFGGSGGSGMTGGSGKTGGSGMTGESGESDGGIQRTADLGAAGPEGPDNPAPGGSSSGGSSSSSSSSGGSSSGGGSSGGAPSGGTSSGGSPESGAPRSDDPSTSGGLGGPPGFHPIPLPPDAGDPTEPITIAGLETIPTPEPQSGGVAVGLLAILLGLRRRRPVAIRVESKPLG